MTEQYYKDKYGRTRIRVPHWMSQEHKAQCSKMLHKLLRESFENKSHMARELGVSRNTVAWWFSHRRIGKKTALKVGGNKQYNMTAADLRPDIYG